MRICVRFIVFKIHLCQNCARNARLSIYAGDFKEAKIHFKKAKGLKISEGPLKDQFRQLEMAMSQSGQMKAAMRQGRSAHGMSGGKGKRRRPKMR